METKVVAIDAMGGDHGLATTVPATCQILEKCPDLECILVGDEHRIKRRLAKRKFKHMDRVRVQAASEVVDMDESPALALRSKKDSSMRVAVDLVKSGQAQACVSAGNTGALMATAKFVLKTLPGVSRPAIMARLPTVADHDVRVLDLGANIDATAEQLVQYAIMGSLVTRAVDGVEAPTVGLLNVGEEDIKGNDQVKATAELLRNVPHINYVGYVEGNDIFSGKVEVVVCDGFVGNIALKAGEGIAKMIAHYAKEEFSRNLFTRAAAALVYPILKRLAHRIDPRERNGASLLGLNGVVIKSHGSADVYSFVNALQEARLQVVKQLPTLIGDEVSQILQGSQQ
ncbi:MAG: phosphate acyltransferase PlsX [Coxiellaceae bacterium]|nr:phosphate acyltransferase PlsX [Coxiellaceae bacterium]